MYFECSISEEGKQHFLVNEPMREVESDDMIIFSVEIISINKNYTFSEISFLKKGF